MRTRDLVIALVGACSEQGECGGTSFQKMTFFAAHLLGVDLGHRAFYYGPFSDLVEQEVSSLALGGLIHEDVTVVGRGPRGPVRKYRYSLTGEGRVQLKLVRDRYPAETESLYLLVDRVIGILGSLDPGLLSAAAAAFFAAEASGEDVGLDEIQRIASENGWDAEDPQLQAVDRLLDVFTQPVE